MVPRKHLLVGTANKVMMWLITGSNGQIGRTAAAFLKSHSIDYRSFSSDELDISNAKQVKSLVESLSPSYILNAAAWTDVDQAEIEIRKSSAINAIGPKNLAVSARGISAKFIHISSDYVFNGDGDSPISELALPAPINHYGKTKAEGDLNVNLAYPEGSFVLRTSWLYSQYGKNFVKTILRKAMTSDGDIFVVDDQVGQPTSATDFINKMYELISYEPPMGVYNITNAGSTSWYGFAREILRLSDLDEERVKPIKSESLKTLAQRPRYSVLSHSKLRDVGLEPMQQWTQSIGQSINEIRWKVEAEIGI